ncbi:DUF6522 family protein [Methylobacterium oxalidis]|uniref:Uncharacterized protein n=1 Tax=Methylobacterium oxalidis TaxID=944322 RepID=A0A512JDU8_9HYPH|nr:DUF6522 family protein [Methylobacterium oxalidis]GEP08120.1 hypothetical protein MOX02_61580 [Methylobacterium oxalidis]GLS67989.1 hypothetical protein GCM10007888_63770 [Methylobacterium oxalidis]
MRLDLDPRGSWLVDPRDLAARLGISVAYLKRQMSRGLVTSRLDPGREEDEGRSRITIRAAIAAWEGIFDRDGHLISERRL